MLSDKRRAEIAISSHHSIRYVTSGEQDAFEYLIKRLHNKGASAKYLTDVVERITGTKK